MGLSRGVFTCVAWHVTSLNRGFDHLWLKLASTGPAVAEAEEW